MGIYRKKPIEVEAFKWTGGPDQTEDPEWIVEALNRGSTIGGAIIVEDSDENPIEIHITTLEGTMTAKIGDWIIKGINGEIYPCKPDIFEASYEFVRG